MAAYETIQYKRWALGIQPASAAESSFTDVFVILGSALVALVVRPGVTIALSLSLSSERGVMIKHSPSFLVFFFDSCGTQYILAACRPSTQ